MKNIIILTFLIVLIVQVQCQGGACGPNAEFVQCKSCCEEATCERRNPPSCNICPMVCNSGCVCKQGYIRQRKDGPCVKNC
ncbi:unnamed protein product [Diabrotica balteata]|uniref:TIL domain-containing protein n=1 Tax=Diabrotica balteata TaxID=107213 RepID=A0A9N9SR78_DIABA|nr:unnamed protein product [Diabrotica balteata]